MEDTNAQLEPAPEKPRYACATCGMAVIVIGESVIRACPHADSGVTANMEAVAYGVGGMAG